MTLKAILGAVAVLGLGACALTPSADNAPAPAFNPAACTERDFVIYFDEGAYDITPGAERIIDLESRAIAGCYIESVRIIGLAAQDEGNQESARALSVRRAEVLSNYLARRASWPRSRFQLLATGERGAVTEEGLDVPVRNRARIIVVSRAP
jgi:outer membrane protein OmpA-like peptidoglycan-associated protein